jgi:GNAT superfamily N-acetyltransferase
LPVLARGNQKNRKVPMIELASGQGTPALQALFPREGPVWRRCFAALAGGSRGRILTDDPHAPRWAAVQEFSDTSSLFLAGSLDRKLVATVISRLRRDRIVTIALSAADPLRALLPPDPDITGVEIDFADRAPEVDLELFITSPPGFHLARIDQELLPRCIWSPWMTAGLATALDQGLGYCILDSEQVVAESFAGPVVDGMLEMAAITHPDYQRRGLAAIVCARTIQECERLGHRTWWNTSLRNVASAELARKLGYRTEHHFDYFAWHASPTVDTPDTAASA